MKLKKYDEKIKYVIITVLLLFSSILNYLFQIIFKIDVVFTHFFYIPTVLACFWWKKIGLFIPLFGLSLVKGIIYKYNGQIWVQDRVAGDYSKGSNFIFLIPQFIE